MVCNIDIDCLLIEIMYISEAIKLERVIRKTRGHFTGNL